MYGAPGASSWLLPKGDSRDSESFLAARAHVSGPAGPLAYLDSAGGEEAVAGSPDCAPSRRRGRCRRSLSLPPPAPPSSLEPVSLSSLRADLRAIGGARAVSRHLASTAHDGARAAEAAAAAAAAAAAVQVLFSSAAARVRRLRSVASALAASVDERRASNLASAAKLASRGSTLEDAVDSLCAARASCGEAGGGSDCAASVVASTAEAASSLERLSHRRWLMVSQVAELYPISALASFSPHRFGRELAIGPPAAAVALDLPLGPAAAEALLEGGGRRAAVALGYVASVVATLAPLLDVALRYEPLPRGATSVVVDRCRGGGMPLPRKGSWQQRRRQRWRQRGGGAVSPPLRWAGLVSLGLRRWPSYRCGRGAGRRPPPLPTAFFCSTRCVVGGGLVRGGENLSVFLVLNAGQLRSWVRRDGDL